MSPDGFSLCLRVSRISTSNPPSLLPAATLGLLLPAGAMPASQTCSSAFLSVSHSCSGVGFCSRRTVARGGLDRGTRGQAISQSNAAPDVPAGQLSTATSKSTWLQGTVVGMGQHVRRLVCGLFPPPCIVLSFPHFQPGNRLWSHSLGVQTVAWSVFQRWRRRGNLQGLQVLFSKAKPLRKHIQDLKAVRGRSYKENALKK